MKWLTRIGVFGLGALYGTPALGGTTTGGEGPATETSDGLCESCDLPDPTVTITSPASGDEVPPAFIVVLEATNSCFCSTCGCYEVEAEEIRIAVDGQPTAGASGAQSEVMLELAPGEHEIRAEYLLGFAENPTSVVTVTVVDGSASTTDAVGSESSSSGSTSDSPNATGSSGASGTDDDASGCACSASTPSSPPLFLLGFGLLFVATRRRER